MLVAGETNPPPPAASPDAGGDPELRRLSAICMQVAESLAARATATEDDEAAGRLAHSLARVARAVRQTKLLEAKLADGSAVRERAARAAANDAADAAPPLVDVTDPRLRKIRAVLAEAIDELPDAEAAEAFERLDAAVELERAAPGRPVIESVLRVARTLGVRDLVDIELSDGWEDYDRLPPRLAEAAAGRPRRAARPP